MSTKRFQVALSFPGEQRAYVAQVANALADRLGREQVFYDEWYTAELARLNLDTYLQAVYHDGAELIVPFLCADYERKKWCGLEWRAIRDLFEKRADADIMPLRFDDTAIPGLFRIDGYIDLRQYTPEQTAAFILQRITPREQTTPNTAIIHSDRLPTVKGGFFGRSAELQLLNDAWANTTTRIIQFIAAGGTGKTKLLRHWLDHTADIPVLIAWSFYSQGSSEDKQTSATPFFSHVFEKLGSTRERFASEEDKGDHLAELLRDKRYVLVLDGLEPLQHGGAAMRGGLKDKAIRQLLRQLARHPCGLCIITTRIAVHELSDRDAPTVIRHDLQNLCEADGVLLLQSLGVKGGDKALQQAVQKYGGHALALSLLGNALRWRFDGDINQIKRVPDLIKSSDDPQNYHAFKIMQAYEKWLEDLPELAILYLLGLFDYPVDQEILEILWCKQPAPFIKDNNIDKFLKAINDLREEHHLLGEYTHNKNIDCHPLIRKYFGRQLQKQYPVFWHQAHKVLYDYYNSLASNNIPDKLQEMYPLFNAIEHGCAAGLHQEAFDNIYWPRISREKEFYLSKKGNFDVDLAVISHFFSDYWGRPIDSLNTWAKANLLRSAGYRLRALGRIQESIEPFTEEQPFWCQLGEPKLYDIVEPHLTLGNIEKGLKLAKEAAEHNYVEFDRHLECFAIYARALHQSGDLYEAKKQFTKIEKAQKKYNNKLKYLLDLAHFRYCELLLENKKLKEVKERSLYNLNYASDELYIGLSELLLGRFHLLNRGEKLHFIEAREYLDKAIHNLQAAGNQDHIPRGLLARAALYRHTRDFARARQDLQEVFDIADSSGMRLHLTDYHLEMARVLLAEMEPPFDRPATFGYAGVSLSGEEKEAKSAQAPYLTREGGGWVTIKEHIEKAAKLIAETGYHRRDAELADLKSKISP